MAMLQDSADNDLDGITPCLFSGKGCQGRVLLPGAPSLHFFLLVPIPAFSHLSE